MKKDNGYMSAVGSLVVLQRQKALEEEMVCLADNMANESTSGYKRKILMPDLSHRGEALSWNVHGDVVYDMTPADREITHNSLDCSIDGPGFFAIQTPQGVAYTRQGSFKLDADRRLVTSSNDPVLTQDSSTISLPEGVSSVKIMPNGEVSTEAGPVGSLGVFTFSSTARFQSLGRGSFFVDEEPQTPEGRYRVMSGTLERSNVSALCEWTHMINVQRHYQQNDDMLKREDDRHRNAIEKILPVR